ncbi:TraX family protein [Pseudomonas jinjuensis]|uniref:TraX protein n=1 Tax=Pseudomonas jinjuensis TaxID=198616 RepID=A0A1H0KB51_9PSED|nr:TraX family protein [Pseudomonas jinjuensis]SDO53086.1 TraX protein [Pseudomonas jinjuensis]
MIRDALPASTALAATGAGRWLPRLRLADGALEALKWLALLLMTGDHLNKYLFNETLPLLFETGRVAMPLFVVVLACNLARRGAGARGAYRRTALRLALFGVLATPPFIALGGLLKGWYPLNILFTLLVITLATAACERAAAGRSLYWGVVAAVVILGGTCVEFWWPAVLLGLSVGWYVRRPGLAPAAGILLSLAALCPLNGNAWAFAALPLVLAATRVTPTVPRWRWLFYVYYPLHLLALWLIRIPMAKAGYLFLI